MIAAQGGDIRVFEDPAGFHRPGETAVIEAWNSGWISSMDTTALGWAVQRTGAGREKAGEPVDAHAGIVFRARRGAKVVQGQPIAVLYATNKQMLQESAELLRAAITISDDPPDFMKFVPLIGRIFTRENAEAHLRDAVR
jgi:pyrimidine-nucleoside phosphorylase